MTQDLPAIKSNDLEAYNPQDVARQIQLIQATMKEVMQDGTHFMTIPGTKNPTLLKAGAEKLCFLFRLRPTYPINDIINLAEGHRECRVTCRLLNMRGEITGEGVGLCSTEESKYKYRYSEGEKVLNPNIADSYNTVLKMAAVRAFRAAVTNATACSDIFTQDLDDIIENDKAAGAFTEGVSGAPKKEFVINAADYTFEYALPYHSKEVNMEEVRRGIKANKQGSFDAKTKHWMLKTERPDLEKWLVKKEAKKESDVSPLADDVAPWDLGGDVNL